MAIERRNPRTRQSAAQRRFGYLVAIVVNAGLLYVVNNILDWDVAPFLTDDFEQVAPIIVVTLWVGILINLIYLFSDAKWIKALAQIGLAGISIAATIRLYQVFPFDFTASDFPWNAITRTILILGIVGTSISIIVEAVKLAGGIGRAGYSPTPAP